MVHAVKEQLADCGTCPRTGFAIRLCYNVFNGPTADTSSSGCPTPTILLLMGLASPAPLWDDKFCAALAATAACRVVRFDNRDIGLSTRLDAPAGGAPAAMHLSRTGLLKLAYAALQPSRRVVAEVYSAHEMALDALRLLAALGATANVHLVGMSLGGIIAQEMALLRPRLVTSLTLISTRSGNPKTAKWPSLKEMLGFISLVPRGSVSARYAAGIAAATTPEGKAELQRECDAERARIYAGAFAQFVERVAGDTARIPFDRQRCEFQMERVFLRSAYMGGCTRQFLALLNTPDRDRQLGQVICCTPGTAAGAEYIPTLIIHGSRDILCPPENGRQLHRLLPGSLYEEVDGMGHTLPPSMRHQFVSWIWGNVARGEAVLAAGSGPAVAAAAAPAASAVASKL